MNKTKLSYYISLAALIISVITLVMTITYIFL
ncbi:Uncharacterised protein [Staphylococcus epidermidis]|nr:Uncharacterised protein [Staphylococcus epidermidis]